DVPYRAGIKRPAFLEPFRIGHRKEGLALFQRHKVQRVAGLSVRRRKPVGRASVSRTHLGSAWAGLHIGTYWPPFAVNALRPIQFFYEWNRRKKLSVNSIENVNIAISICLDQQVAGYAFVVSVHEDWRLRRVVVEQVVWGELEIPLQLAGIRIQSQHAIRVQVIAGTSPAFEIRSGIARSPEKRI